MMLRAMNVNVSGEIKQRLLSSQDVRKLQEQPDRTRTKRGTARLQNPPVHQGDRESVSVRVCARVSVSVQKRWTWTILHIATD